MRTHTKSFKQRKVLWVEFRTTNGTRWAPQYSLERHIIKLAGTGRKILVPAGFTETETLAEIKRREAV